MKTCNTYYSVQYIDWGMSQPETMWFDNLAEAKEFASHDYRDNVVVHNVKNDDKINYIEGCLEFQKMLEKYNGY